MSADDTMPVLAYVDVVALLRSVCGVTVDTDSRTWEYRLPDCTCGTDDVHTWECEYTKALDHPPYTMEYGE